MTKHLPRAEGRGTVNDDLLAAYRQDEERRGLLPSSIEKSRLLVRALMRAFPGDIFELTRTDIENFLDGRDIGAKARHSYASHLHGFYRWAVMEGLTDNDPTEHVRRPRLRRTLPRPASTDDLLLAVGCASPQMRCWLLLAAFQGLRCKEIAGLQREDVVTSQGVLRVSHAKGQHERIVPLHPDVLAALERLPMPASGPVFPTLTPQRVSRRINDYLRDLGIACTAHQLRHWFGTELYRSTRDLRLVQEMLGHQSPSATAGYTAFDVAGATEAVRALALRQA